MTLMEKYPSKKIDSESGFTLIEHMVTLSILSIIFLLIMPLSFKRIDEMTNEQLINLLSNDILYTQNLAFHYPADDVRLRFYSDSYAILIGHDRKVQLARQFPTGWEIGSGEIYKISFSKSGTVLNSRTIKINTSSGTYEIILPLGKGRERIVKK